MVPSRNISPSAAARATRLVPTMPAAAPTFSTITCWCRISLSRGANTRPITSNAPPAANGTTMVTGRVGHSCAGALAVVAASAAMATTIRRASMGILPDARTVAPASQRIKAHRHCGGLPPCGGPPQRNQRVTRMEAQRHPRRLRLSLRSRRATLLCAVPGKSPASEQPLDIAELQFHVGRTPVVALAGIGRRLHFPQQRVHLFNLEAAPRAHRAVAGHGRGHMHEAPLERQRLVPFRHMLAEIAKKRARIDRAEQRRCLAHRDGSRAERLDGKAEAQELRGARDEPLDVGLIEFDDVRNQQDLPADAGAVERRLETLVDDALVGGVLIDDDEAVAGLRDDV